jgi:hypothetical protein
MNKSLIFLAILTSVFFISCEKDETPDVIHELTCEVSVDSVSVFGSNDGKITVMIVTGNGSYELICTSGSINAGSITLVGDIFTVQNLAAGNYNITVTDDASKTFTKSVSVYQPNEVIVYDELKATITVNHNNTDWVDNCIVINATGGKVPYKYEIIGVDHTSNHTDDDGVFSTISGIFNVVVTDDLNNKVTFNNVEVYAPFDINVDFVNADNTTSDNGKIKIQNFFNRDDVTIKINDGDWVSYTFDGSGWVTIDNVKYGNYTITAKDGHNRTRTKGIEIKSLYGSLRDGGLVFHIFSDGDSAYVAYPTDNSSMNWNDAMTASNSGGWFLPNMDILEILLNIAKNDNRFNILINTLYWSNNEVSSTNSVAKRINLNYSIGVTNPPKTNSLISRKVKKIKL